jgi:prophage DNA circulation protein
MTARGAARFNPDLREKYRAMTAAGKPRKLALTALMRKPQELSNTRPVKTKNRPKIPLDQDGYSNIKRSRNAQSFEELSLNKPISWPASLFCPVWI